MNAALRWRYHSILPLSIASLRSQITKSLLFNICSEREWIRAQVGHVRHKLLTVASKNSPMGRNLEQIQTQECPFSSLLLYTCNQILVFKNSDRISACNDWVVHNDNSVYYDIVTQIVIRFRKSSFCLQLFRHFKAYLCHHNNYSNFLLLSILCESAPSSFRPIRQMYSMKVYKGAKVWYIYMGKEGICKRLKKKKHTHTNKKNSSM